MPNPDWKNWAASTRGALRSSKGVIFFGQFLFRYKRLSDKYVRRGVEENRKLLVIKNKKVDELNENAHRLQVELNRKSDELADKIEHLTGSLNGNSK